MRRTAESSEVENDKTFLPSNWDLRIVGDGPERSEIERLVADAGSEAASRIQLLGYKSGEDLQREVGTLVESLSWLLKGRPVLRSSRAM